MGALTINRNKRDSEFQSSSSSSSSYYYGYDHLHFPKKLKSSNSKESKRKSSSISRLSLYPEKVTPITRPIHAPITVVTTFTSNHKQLEASSSFIPKNKDNSGDRMGNFLYSKYICAKDAALRTLRHVVFDMEDEVVEVVNNNDNDGSGDSGVEEVGTVKCEKDDVFNKSGEVRTIAAKYRELDEKSEQRLGFQASTSSRLVSDFKDGRTFENLSLNRRRDVGEGLYYQKLQSESAKKRDPELRRLDFDIKLYEEKRASLAKSRPAKKEEDVLIEPFRPLTDDDVEMVDNAFSNSSRRKVLVTHENSNITITGEMLRCLRPKAWLNDEVINVYLELLKEREKKEPQKFLKCHFFNTFFYKKLISGKAGYDYKSVRRWTTQKKLGYSLLECDKIFVPVHKEIHWCLAVINKKEEKFQYLDSLGGIDKQVMRVLAKYIVDEVKDKNGEDIDVSYWKQEYVRDLPNQENGFDCGVFMIKYADFYSRGIGLCFNQEHMPYFRLRTAKELLRLKAD
ncbi:ubiquitin-like-specific protease ESD4 [Rutidosis leptorrhynchoides]|uniref:ubiquitin-like-specific protease ESD4 n=1 Tax=Rutidosis leptorrhynchoides TaxID=125765 RepID=UPI003A9A0765